MARLAECCPSSDDDLPDLNVLLRKSSVRAERDPKSVSNTEAKPLAPKSTSSKPGSRRVRRLGDGGRATTNPLFQPWSSKEPEDPQAAMKDKKKEPRFRDRQVPERTPSLSASSDEEEDDEPQLPTRRSRRRRTPIIEDLEEDTGEASHSEEESILTRVRNLQRNRSGTITGPKKEAKKEVKKETKEEDNRETKKESSSRQVKSKSKASELTKAFDSDSETETVRGDEPDDLSIYKTAEENSSDFSDGSASDSALDDLAFEPSRKLRLKPSTQSRKPSGSKEALPLTKDVPRLGSRGPGPRKTSASSQKKDLCETEKTSDRKRNQGGRSLQRHNTDGSNASTSTSAAKTTAADLADTLSKLRLQLQDFSDEDEKPSTPDQFTTPPCTPPKTTKAKGLTSPTKRNAIPKTPHRPSTDDFWSQDLVNDWNDLHSPRKLMLPPVSKSPAKTSPKKTAEKKETKKAFETRKHELAESFLAELDREITQGKIAELAKATGGVKLVWTKTLNTTAGRASWRREMVRTRRPDGTQASVEHKHHSSIELAEKVIDDEHRLLNVLAHEFCHLANFMVSGVTTNPHGKEFKAWAARCSRVFADRGIEVTTKHSYDIDFKYVWQCGDCGAEFKRHSRSIDTQRHRCGSCKGALRQTKPAPRGKGDKGPSRWQVFVREQMAVVRAENPGSPQKEVMRMIADKWKREDGGKGGKAGVDGVVDKMGGMALED